jgi:hypothetical protein
VDKTHRDKVLDDKPLVSALQVPFTCTHTTKIDASDLAFEVVESSRDAAGHLSGDFSCLGVTIG